MKTIKDLEQKSILKDVYYSAVSDSKILAKVMVNKF